MDKLLGNILASLGGQGGIDAFAASSIFTMSNSKGKLITGNMNPASEGGKSKLKLDIENIFSDTITCNDKSLMLSTSGNTTEDGKYFNSLLSEMKKKYPEVIVESLFNCNFGLRASE